MRSGLVVARSGLVVARVVLVAAAVALAGVGGPQRVEAASTPTVTTITHIDPSLRPLAYGDYVAQVTPVDAKGSVLFETSIDDGATWQYLALAAPFGTNQYSLHWQVDAADVTWLVRAEFQSSTQGYDGSFSTPAQQVIAKAQSQITDLSLDSAGSPVVPGSRAAWLTAWLSGIGSVLTGSLTFEEQVGADWVLLGSVHPASGAPNAAIQIPVPSQGDHTYRVTYPGDPQSLPSSATFVRSVEKAQAHLTLSAPSPVEANADLFLSMQLGPEITNADPPSGTVTFSEGGVVVAGVDARNGGVDLGPQPIGSHTYTASYSGDGNYLPATSNEITVQVVPDIVHASVGTLTAAVVYPYRDGYRDTVSARGSRSEPVSASFKVRNASGKVVRTGAVALGTGAYAWIWNGRTATGGQVPAGTYTIETVLRDAAGTTKSARQSVTVSAKRLYWHSTTLYRTGRQTETSHTSWASWLFTMPSATAYRNLVLGAYGHATISFEPSAVGPHDRRNCAFRIIDPGCARVAGSFRVGDQWVTVRVDATYGRSGRQVRGYVWAGPGGGKVWVSRLRLHVEYGLLR